MYLKFEDDCSKNLGEIDFGQIIIFGELQIRDWKSHLQ